MKYMGSKQRIADEILFAIYIHAKPTDTFVDLFCGGCSVIERVDPKQYRRIANDKNIYLIEMFRLLVNTIDTDRNKTVEEIRDCLAADGRFPLHITKELYSLYRNRYHDCEKGESNLPLSNELAQIGWAGWMGSFNGRFFSGGYAGHEVKIKSGATRDYIREQIDNTLRQIPALKEVDFHYEDYADVSIPLNAIVYCDIPYRGTKQYETSKNFDYNRFYEWCRQNHDKYQIFVSEYAMPDDFECIWEKSVTTTINPNKTLKPVEKLFKIVNP